MLLDLALALDHAQAADDVGRVDKAAHHRPQPVEVAQGHADMGLGPRRQADRALRGDLCNASASRVTPSSSGHDDDHVHTSSIQVSDVVASLMLGMTEIGLPADGTTMNQGRVGLCQKGMWNPVK
ncbi:MAG: hypothetical protein OXB90_00535 [Acidimicrobiaceae bacterium]|nr:hypothetical protein [Acidimicrobiaceae bacterium]